MKLLCLSDLHQRMNDISDVIHQERFTPFLQSIRDVVTTCKDYLPVRRAGSDYGELKYYLLEM